MGIARVRSLLCPGEIARVGLPRMTYSTKDGRQNLMTRSRTRGAKSNWTPDVTVRLIGTESPESVLDNELRRRVQE